MASSSSWTAVSFLPSSSSSPLSSETSSPPVPVARGAKWLYPAAGFLLCAGPSSTSPEGPRRAPRQSRRRTAAPRRSSGAESQRPPRRSPAPRSPPRSREEVKRRHWREGEFPGNVKKKLEDREAAKAWVSTVTESLAERIQKKDWEGTLEVFEMLRVQPFYSPKEGTYMKLLVLLGRSGQPAAAQKLFDTMVEEGLDPTAELYTALLSAYSRSNLLDEAFSVLTTMKALPLCQPDVYTYSNLLKACADGGRFDLVDALASEMAERGITPNTVTQNVVLGGYGRAGRFEDMERVLAEMVESSVCPPDVWTMNIILGLLANAGRIELMERWYEKFRGIGIEPETRTFNILIGAYGRRGLYDKMTSVLEYMRKASFAWTTATYNNVIEAFAGAGDAKHMECAFEQMRAERMKADTKTFCCLIAGYSNSGLFHKGRGTMTTAFFNAVLSACAKAGDLVEMERVFRRMKDARRSPDATTYTIMAEAYRGEGMTDRIYELEQELQSVTGVAPLVAL
ncbi:unnamed protein product [Spirodela intermedia]|uniref:Uncharacterized protein n=1 Tax=Spirodela intermedia TaxID=51605 RepID=A0A7I8IW10_SPIIN|nr:unnamed protein product [Spirodela intermedia]CAA6662168.1 unnamed protein product [Spirodela intermedia]